MIKDKITPALKERFRQVIKKIIDTGEEQGFFICSNKDGKLYSSKPCEGDECRIILGDQDQSIICPHGIQGDFHTHAYLHNAKRKYRELGKQIPIDDILKQEIRRSLTEMQEEKGIVEPIAPSYRDTLNAVIHKCFKDTDTITCVASDLEENKINCWKPKDVRKGQCVRAVFELRKAAGRKKEFFPKKWIVPLFDKEQITL